MVPVPVPVLVPELLPSVVAVLESLPSGPELSLGPPLLLVEPGSVVDGGGPLVSVGSGLLVVLVAGGVPVSPVVFAGTSVSVDGTSHSPMHTGSGSPHAEPEDQRSSPRAATALRFMCTNRGLGLRAG